MKNNILTLSDILAIINQLPDQCYIRLYYLKKGYAAIRLIDYKNNYCLDSLICAEFNLPTSLDQFMQSLLEHGVI